MKQRALLEGARRKRTLIVLFIPSVERDGATEINQDRFVEEALDFFGNVFGGATAYPRARGIWRDDERGGKLIRDNPVVLQCYLSPEAIENKVNLARLGEFCRRLGREANQGEIGLVIDGEYLAITDFEEEHS